MRLPIDDKTGCAFCRFLRGVAFGGIGAAAGALPALALGADQDTILYLAFFSALIIGGWLNRRLGG